MWLYPGRGCNLIVLGHSWLCQQLFHKMGTFHLPATVVPLHINSERSAILAWMPDSSAAGAKESWKLPKLADETKWASELKEEDEREETDHVKTTTAEEEAYIASRIAEARRSEATRAAGLARDTADDEEEEEVEEDDDNNKEPAEEGQEELGGDDIAGTETT